MLLFSALLNGNLCTDVDLTSVKNLLILHNSSCLGSTACN